MGLKLEDYGLIGDLQSAALVGKNGSIDWLCLPRFDSSAVFAGLLGSEENGRWLLRPEGNFSSQRRYAKETLLLETKYEGPDGTAIVIDFMPLRGRYPDVARVVKGVRGEVHFSTELIIRMDYGSTVPWIRHSVSNLCATAGPNSLRLDATVPIKHEGTKSYARFSVKEGETVSLVLTWFPSHEKLPPKINVSKALEEAEQFWHRWAKRCTYDGPYRAAVLRSLITLKALTYQPTGGIVAAPTTSLPESLSGVRNWDYRYCWLRDATFTLYSLLLAGYKEEACAWREWLVRAVAGSPEKLQIMYRLDGDRRSDEYEADWLAGYEGSRPVRLGNAAYKQYQLDVYGELMDTLQLARRTGLETELPEWHIQTALLDYLETGWTRPDKGIWEVRGPDRDFTYSKVMAWVAFDRAIAGVERQGLRGPVDRWRKTRDSIRQEVLEKGFNRKRGAFVQYYGSDALDASLLNLTLVGFLPATDPRMRATIEAVEKELVVDGFVMRYRNKQEVDGLPKGEGAFLACSFWLCDNLVLLGRKDDARQFFERLVGLSSDLGLLSEEYDPREKRLVGNFPQAFSHVALVNSAFNLNGQIRPLDHRAGYGM